MKPEPVALDDAELLNRMLTGRGDAWKAFHVRYDRLIWSGIHKVTRRFGTMLGRDDVREIYAVFMASLWANDMHKLRSFDVSRGNKLGTWISLLVTHTTFDHLRAMVRHPAWEPLSAAEDIPDSDDPFQSLCRREERDQLAALVAGLSLADQHVVHQLLVQDQDPATVAAAMGVATRTVYLRKHRIRARLQSFLEGLRVAAAA